MKKKYLFFLKRFLYYIYGEKFYKRLDYKWSQFPNRVEIIQKIINEKHYEKYLEIGCDRNENFSKIKIKTKVGVDPLRGGTVRTTSDEFFKSNTEKFDIIFLDGLHTYNQTIKDINNSLKCINSNGVILIHDCLPTKIWNQIVPRMYGHWNGDVWKAIVESRTYQDVDTYTCIADHGLGIIFKRKNRNMLNLKIENFNDLKFSEYFKNHKEYMNPISHKKLLEIF
tara:strand:- start:1036 stop:1710 length:675 start_codon:yes stop_codon:yes gene_type:complete